MEAGGTCYHHFPGSLMGRRPDVENRSDNVCNEKLRMPTLTEPSLSDSCEYPTYLEAILKLRDIRKPNNTSVLM